MYNGLMYKNGTLRHKLYNKYNLKSMLKIFNENFTSEEWHTMEVGEAMNKYIKRCINLILSEECCKEVVYFKEDDTPRLWIILDEDCFETNMNISGIIEDCLEFPGIDLEYSFFDEDERVEIEQQLDMMSISARRFDKDGK